MAIDGYKEEQEAYGTMAKEVLNVLLGIKSTTGMNYTIDPAKKRIYEEGFFPDGLPLESPTFNSVDELVEKINSGEPISFLPDIDGHSQTQGSPTTYFNKDELFTFTGSCVVKDLDATLEANKTNEILKEVAEHPIKYSMKSVQNFGHDFMNNASMKDSFATLKENMAATIGARQACLDNELTYRTYKAQAMEGIKKAGSTITTPTKNIATSAISGVMDKISATYKSILDKVAETIATNTTPSRKNLMIKEAISLGSFSANTNLKNSALVYFNNSNSNEMLGNRLKAIQDDLTKAKPGSFKENVLLKEEKKTMDLIDFVKSGELHGKVWGEGKQSPDDKFQDAKASVKTFVADKAESTKDFAGNVIAGAGNAIENAKKVPEKVANFFKTIGTTIKDSAMKAVEKVANVGVHVQNQYMDLKRNATIDMSKSVLSISDFVSRQELSVQKVAKDTSIDASSKRANIDVNNNKISSIKDGTAMPSTYVSDKTKAIKSDLTAMQGMHNSQAGRLCQLMLESSIISDKKEAIKALKVDNKALESGAAKVEVKNNMAMAAKPVLSEANTLLSKLNNVILRAGEKAKDQKWKEVDFSKNKDVEVDLTKLSAKELKEMIDRDEDIDFDKCSLQQIDELKNEFDVDFTMNAGKVSLSNKGGIELA